MKRSLLAVVALLCAAATAASAQRGLVTYDGVYNAGTPYHVDDTVTYAGSTYIALAPSTGVTPGTNGADWQLYGAGNLGATTWGSIGGSLSNQTDLYSVLAGKQATLGFTPENTANKGVANGYAPLDATGKVPTINLPSTGGGTGTVTSFSLSGLPPWLPATLTNPTTTPTITFSPGAIPNSALQYSSTNVNGQPCLLGGSCTISSSAAPFLSFLISGDSISCAWNQALGNAAGSAPPYSIRDPGCAHLLYGWPYWVQADLGVVANDNAIPADESGDLWARQLVSQSGTQPTINAPLATAIAIGTNNANHEGVGSAETDHKSFLMAAALRQLTPAEFFVTPSSCTASGWTFGSNVNGAYALSSTVGATLTCPLPASGSVVYPLHGISSGVAGVVSYTVDGGAAQTWNTAPAAGSLNTQNGTTNTVGAERYAGLVSGATHTLTLTLTSGAASYYGTATLPTQTFTPHSIVAISNVPRANAASGSTYAAGGNYYSAEEAYSTDNHAVQTQLAADGWDARWVDSHAYLTGLVSSDYTDEFHLTEAGAAKLSRPWANVFGFGAIATRVASLTTSGGSGAYSVSGGTVSGSNNNSDSTSIGCSGSCTPGGSNIAVPITASGSLAEVKAGVNTLNGGGTFDVLLMTCAGCDGVTTGGTMTVNSRFTLTPAASGTQTFYAGRDFTAVNVTAGQYIGVYPNGAYLGAATSTMPSVSGGSVSGTSGGTDAGAVSSSTNALILPSSTTGTLSSITLGIGSNSGSSFDLIVASCAGCASAPDSSTSAVSIVSRYTVAVSGTGLQTFYAGRDFPSGLSVSAGQYVGIYSAGLLLGYKGSPNSGWINYTGNPASSANWNVNTLYQADMSFNIGGTVAGTPGGYLYANNTNPASGTAFVGNGSYAADFSANVGGTVSSSGSAPTSDVVPVLGMTSAGHCPSIAARNATAASNISSFWATPGTGTVTVNHAGVAGMQVDLSCTPF